MAEVINELQERLLPEYEQLKKFDICTDEQIRECIRRRENFYSKITQCHKSVRDYADFILFEKKVHKWISEKDSNHGKKLTGLKSSIVSRIIRLYRECLRVFPAEERFWQNYIKFSKKSLPHEVYSIYEKMLTYHGDKPHVWCDAALWAYEYNLDLAKVKNVLFRALQRHPESETINKTFFDIMLERASKMSTERKHANDTLSEQDIGMQQVEAIYTNSKNKIGNVEYFLRLLERCEEQKFMYMTAPLQKQILDDIMQVFPREEVLWDSLAQRELRGFNMADLQKLPKSGEHSNAKSSTAPGESSKKAIDSDAEAAEDQEDIKDIGIVAGGIWQKRTLKRRIELCCDVYKTAVETLQTPKMWTLYINAMLKLNQDMSTQQAMKRKCLAMAFRQGHDSRLMSIEHYCTFIRMLLESSKGMEVAEPILQEAIKIHKAVEIYELWLSTFVVENDESKVFEIFQRANQELGVEKCFPLWRLTINFYKTRYEDCAKRLLKIYREACRQPYATFGVFRGEYLDFCMINMPMEKIRVEYDKLCQLPPASLELHRRMAKLESQLLVRKDGDLDRWRKCHENATYYFGKTDITVWHEYMKFERDHGDPKRLSLLYDRAKDTLNANLVDDFISQHALLITMA